MGSEHGRSRVVVEGLAKSEKELRSHLFFFSLSYRGAEQPATSSLSVVFLARKFSAHLLLLLLLALTCRPHRNRRGLAPVGAPNIFVVVLFSWLGLHRSLAPFGHSLNGF